MEEDQLRRLDNEFSFVHIVSEIFTRYINGGWQGPELRSNPELDMGIIHTNRLKPRLQELMKITNEEKEESLRPGM